MLAGAPLLASEALYRQYKVRRTFTVDRGVKNPFGKSDVLAVDFLTTGFAKPDGSDIRVFAGAQGRRTQFKVMMMGPGDRVRVAIRISPGVREYHVCYGGPRNPVPSRWEPEVGLILETRKFNGGNVRNPKQMNALVKASGPSFGKWFVPRVFQGYNLFGPSEAYVSIYSGTLHVPKPGDYQFATTSDDASYMVVAGKVAASKPRWGRGPADARFSGKPMALKAGAHAFTYYHVEGTHMQFCVAAWKPPGDKFHLIPASAFPGVFTGKLTGLKVSGAPIPIDLLCHAAGEVLYEKHHLYKVKFYDASLGLPALRYKTRWFFGDGTSSDDRNPAHIYFRPGEYTVTLAMVRGRSAVRIRQKIVVGSDWEHQGQRRKHDTAAKYYELVKDYDYKSMRPASGDAALEFFATMGKDLEIMKAAAGLLTQDDELVRKNVYRYAVLLGERLRDIKHLPAEALLVFRAAVRREADEVKKARLTRRIGDTLLYVMNKPDEALAEYRIVLDRYGKLKDNVVRLAQIRVGDAQKARGAYKEALAAYEKAHKMKAYQRTHAIDSTRRGAFAQSIEGYLARKQFGQAQELLDFWGWEHPVDRLRGEWSTMAVRVGLAKGETGTAIREALDCANANKGGPYADRLLLMAAKAMADAGREKEAIGVVARIRKDYPESAHQAAAALVECRALYKSRQYADAAKLAAKGYGDYGKAEEAPDFLMVAADAAIEQKSKTRAVKLLELIVKDYPKSDAAPAAEAKLKILKPQ
jgi:TolA-binding protein